MGKDDVLRSKSMEFSKSPQPETNGNKEEFIIQRLMDRTLSQIDEEQSNDDAFSNNLGRLRTSANFDKSVGSLSVSPVNLSDNQGRRSIRKSLRESLSSTARSSINYGTYAPDIVGEIE